MRQLSGDAVIAWKAHFPTLFSWMEATAAIIFFTVFMFGFVFGAVWQGLISGFVTGRDI